MSGFGHLTGMGQPLGRGVSFPSNVPIVDLSQLKQGDVFKGEITAVSGEEVQLYLGNGQYMQARLEHDVQLALGQILNFQVQSNTGDKLVLKPLYQNAYQNRVGEAALKAAGIPVNERNMQLIAKMIESGLPIHKESVGKLYRQMLATPKASMEQLMQMNRMHLKVTPESFAQFQKYEGLQHSLSNAIQDMVDEAFEVYEKLQSVEKEATVPQNTNVNMEQAFSQDVRQTSHSNAMPKMQGADMAGGMLQDATVPRSMDGVLYMERLLQLVSGAIKANGDVQPNMQAFVSQDVYESMERFMSDGSQASISRMADTLLQTLQEKQISLAQLQMLLQTRLSGSELGEMSARAVKEKIFHSGIFRSCLQEAMEENMRLTPDEIMEDKTTDFYKRLYEQSHELVKLIQETGTETVAQGKSAQNVQQNIDFMNQLNQVFQYVQLPLKLSENNAHGELYVFTNKRNLAKRDGVLTALLHLDMEHLGSMDIHVAMQMETSQVTTRFAVREDMLDFVGTHMESLTERLREKGYTCHASCEAGVKEKSVIEYVEEQLAGTTVPLMYQTFDIRA